MVRCRVCIKPKKSFAVMSYLRQRVIRLRHGCLCNNRLIYWPLAHIAEALGLHINAVMNILTRWRQQNFQFPKRRRQQNWRAKRLSSDQLTEITSTEELQRQAVMTLRERAEVISRRYRVTINAATLLRYYKAAGI